jgi:hypothetical protein
LRPRLRHEREKSKLSEESKPKVLTPNPEQGGMDTGEENAPMNPLGGLASQTQHIWRQLLRQGKQMVGRDPILLPLLLRLTPLGISRQITAFTDLVVEGFPRSGNTYTTFALEDASGHSLEIASHVHQPSQIKFALARGVPTVMVIREPTAALASHLVYDPQFTPAQVTREYCSYHWQLVPYVERVLICEFSEVTTDMASVIDRINHRYSMTIPAFDESPANIERIQSKIVRHHELVHQDVGPLQGAPIPFAGRRESSERMREALLAPENQTELAQAIKLYEYFCSVASEQRQSLPRVDPRPDVTRKKSSRTASLLPVDNG